MMIEDSACGENRNWGQACILTYLQSLPRIILWLANPEPNFLIKVDTLFSDIRDESRLGMRVNFGVYFFKILLILVRIKKSCFLSLALPFLLATSESKSGNGLPFPQLFSEAVP